MPKSKPAIAVVDDDDLIRKSLGRLLRSAGFQVTTFESAEAFLQSTSNYFPACLILDIKMPGISGLELYRKLAERKQQRPTIFISAHEAELTRAQSEAPHEAGFLLKPFDSDELINAVRIALDGNKLPEESPT